MNVTHPILVANFCHSHLPGFLRNRIGPHQVVGILMILPPTNLHVDKLYLKYGFTCKRVPAHSQCQNLLACETLFLVSFDGNASIVDPPFPTKKGSQNPSKKLNSLFLPGGVGLKLPPFMPLSPIPSARSLGSLRTLAPDRFCYRTARRGSEVGGAGTPGRFFSSFFSLAFWWQEDMAGLDHWP